MSKFSFFNPFSWFKSEERNELKELKEAIVDLRSAIAPKSDKPYKNIIVSGTNITIVFHSGDIIQKGDVTQETMGKILVAKTEDEIKAFLYNKDYRKTPEEVKESEDLRRGKVHQPTETDAEVAIVRENAHALEGHPDFEIRAGEVFLKGVELAIPTVIAGSFIELVERINIALKKGDDDNYVDLDDKFNSLKLFWCWLALNPIEEARRDAIVFIRKNKITIDVNGLLIMYRRVVAQENKTDKEWNNFVSSSYAKIKKAKKGPKSYFVHLVEDQYVVNKNAGDGKDGDTLVGNLAELYTKLADAESNIYTDNHTKTKQIKIGKVYKEDEDKINLDNTQDCGSGLHVGAESFGFGGFGDTGVVTLVNPMYIRSVPVSATNKMRVSEMFIVGAYDLKNYKEDVENQELIDFSVDYCTTNLDALKDDLAKKDLGKMICQTKKTTLSVKDVVDITTVLEGRIKNLS